MYNYRRDSVIFRNEIKIEALFLVRCPKADLIAGVYSGHVSIIKYLSSVPKFWLLPRTYLNANTPIEFAFLSIKL